jgi:excisionase family DNA binding protein
MVEGLHGSNQGTATIIGSKNDPVKDIWTHERRQRKVVNRTLSDHNLLSIKQISNEYNLSEHWLYWAVENGRIPHFRLGKLIRFRIQDMERWLLSTRRGGESVRV